MRACLLAIGCDRYSELPPLNGAEADAKRVFEALTATGQFYRPADSRLLLSPTKLELDDAVRGLANDSTPIEVLTLYFAGHGSKVAGSYYLCLRDSSTRLLSGTSLALSHWLGVVKEISPRYSYIVMDACYAGGGHGEIANLLNDPSLGRDNASTFACLAAASADQYAHETEDGGVMTGELLRVIDGRTTTATTRPELDLLDVARAVSERMEGGVQKPNAWGLNLFGPGRFCRNPLPSASDQQFHVPDLSPGSPLANRIRLASEELWEIHRSAGKEFDVGRVRGVVVRIIGDAPAADASAFVLGLSNALISRLRATGQEWAIVEAYSLFACLLLRYVREDQTAAAIARELLVARLALEKKLIRILCAAAEADPHALLNHRAPLAEFFYLPLRLSKLLAWLAHGLALADAFGLADADEHEVRRTLVNLILRHYGTALRVVCDQQGSHLFVWFQYARKFGWTEELEEVFGAYFADLVAIEGNVARGNIEPEIAFEYCLARGKEPSGIEHKWVANPSQLLAVMLLAATDNSLADEVDPFLERLDHRHFNIFFPADYGDLAKEVIESGVNRAHCIGMDVWTCADYHRLFSSDLAAHIASASLPVGDLEIALGVTASLLFPDRIAVFLSRAP